MKTLNSISRARAKSSSAGAVVLGVVACAAVVPAARAQSVWNGTNDNNWNNATNWSAGVPNGVQAQFSNTAPGPGGANLTLNNTQETPSGILFTGAIPSYTIGSSVNDGTLQLNTAGTSAAGALAVASTVKTPQTINSGFMSTAAAPIFITNLSTLASTTGVPGLTMAGTITPPTSGGLEFVQTASAMTVVSGTIIANSNGGVIAGLGTLRLTGQNTYTGGTSFDANGTGRILQVGSSSNALPGGSFTSGPLGTGSINANNNVIEPVGGDQHISNAIVMSSGGFTFQVAPTTGANADTTTGGPFNFEVDGPISYTTTATQGRTLSCFMNSTNGNTLTFGSASAPSTFTLTQLTTSSGSIFKANVTANTKQLVIINDVIQDNPAKGANPPDTLLYGQNANSGNANNFTIFRINGANTYNGGPGTQLEQPNTTYQLGVNTTGTPGAVTSGPFGQGPVLPTINGNNTVSQPTLEAFGADRTLANSISLATSGFFVDSAATTFGTGSGLGADPSGAHNLTISGVISGTVATNGMTVQNGGVVLVTNANTYNGPTLVTNTASNPGGKLLVNNTSGSGTGTGAVTANGTGTGASAVGTGGILAGTGTISGSTTIGSASGGSQGGVVAPGPGGTTPGTLHVAGMTWNSYARYMFQYNGSDNTAGSGVNSEIVGTGALTLSNTPADPFDLNLQQVVAGATSGPYILADFAGGVGIATGTDITNMFTFSGTATATPQVLVADDGGGGQELELFVPEPSFAVAACGAVGALLMRRRRTSVALSLC